MVEQRSPKPLAGGSSPSCPAIKGNFMENIINFIKEARLELQKVIFPTKEQVKNAYIAVFLVVTVVSLFLALVDGIMSFILSHIM